MKNYSKQREEVLDIVKSSYSHPTAEEVYQDLKSKGGASSRSTVYRNLGLLEEDETIKKIAISNKPDRYDYIRKPHNHVICSKCGKIADFEYDFRARQIIEAIKEDTNMDTELDSIVVMGICNECNVGADDPVRPNKK